MELGTWLTTINWGDVAIDVAIPVAAILIPTIIAVRLSLDPPMSLEWAGPA